MYLVMFQQTLFTKMRQVRFALWAIVCQPQSVSYLKVFPSQNQNMVFHTWLYVSLSSLENIKKHLVQVVIKFLSP